MKEYIMEVKETGMVKRVKKELVRCKDCRFYPDGEGTTKWLPCREIPTAPGWYCADGERREDNA